MVKIKNKPSNPHYKDAVRWSGENNTEVCNFFEGHCIFYGKTSRLLSAELKCKDGTLYIVRPGDWIIKGTAGNFYVVTQEIFDKNYEICL